VKRFSDELGYVWYLCCCCGLCLCNFEREADAGGYGAAAARGWKGGVPSADMGTPPPSTPSNSAPTPASPSPKGGSHVFQAPTGTRDFYPAELNRLRYVQEAWRRTSINHGFEEIDGPAFEHLELYTAKSGEGIVSELFSFERFGGEKTFALRPEFTPTLARMYAAKAASLPKPTKWFWQQNCYRAERPQRGRLREFCQWNCDIIGDDSAAADGEVIACCVGMMESLGLTPKDVRVCYNNRLLVEAHLYSAGVPVQLHAAWMNLLDREEKISPEQFYVLAKELGADAPSARRVRDAMRQVIPSSLTANDAEAWVSSRMRRGDEAFERLSASIESSSSELDSEALETVRRRVGEMAQETELMKLAINRLEQGLDANAALIATLTQMGLQEWIKFDDRIVRGLAYYTGMVFEVHEASGAERAIAGGGRYDKLIEMFGGPPTPAVGFGMGDVVLSLVLQDKGLMPKDEEVAAKLGLSPDALVISNGTPEADGAVAGVIASLRRAGLHARRSYKTTKNVGKLIQDAAKMRARFCVILESGTAAQIKDMQTQVQESCGVAEIAEKMKR
jgi:histidyl-tRNA synthetase